MPETKVRKSDIKKQTVQSKIQPSLGFINHALATLFYIIWILIGLAILLLIYANIKQGAIGRLLNPAPPAQTSQAPTETELPGVGKVNIECVLNSLPTETIQKISKEEGISNLTDKEKESLAPCIVEAQK